MSMEKKPEKKEDDLAIIEAGDENPERGNWTGKLDFLLSCLGYAVGLGNVWRFPYLCYKHGGGAFLIPYALMLLFIGIPCFFLEISIGQYAALGPVTIYSNLSPLFKGLGFANFLASCFVGLYYNMIIAWTIYYLFASFTSELPWSDCNNEFNDEFCFSVQDYKNCTSLRANNTKFANAIYHLGKCINDPEELDMLRGNLSHYYGCQREVEGQKEKADGIFINATECVEPERYSEIEELFDIPNKIRKTSSEQYLRKKVLKESKGIEDMGEVQWHLALCLLAAWIIIFFCLIKGIKSSGKVVYFTATFPYVVLVILFFRAVTLPGAGKGVEFYIYPKWDRLSSIEVWEGAAVQIFFSLSVAGGGLITLASYNKFHNNVIRDTMIVCLGNCLTSFFAGFAIFSVLGFLAKELGVEIEDVVQSGTGLAFIAYPDLVTRLPGAPFWAILFFAMLFTLGLDSQFAIVETILTGIMDFKPELRSKKTIIVGIVCIVGFLCGLPLTTEGGGYLLDLLDYYAAGWPYLFIGFTELIIISYVYGIQNFFDDLYHICKFNPGTWAKTHLMVLYTTLSPFIIGVILIVSWARYEPLTKGSDYVYPEWSNAIGWIIAMTAILAVPLMAIFQIAHKFFVEYHDLDFSEKFHRTKQDLLNYTPEWRANADRARRRDGNSNGSAHNGAIAPTGFDNLAMEHDEQNSKL